jgi:hypothetical protein
MAKHAFLSVEWIETVTTLQMEYRDRMPVPAVKMRMNQVIIDVPFGEGEVKMHIDSTGGAATFGLGHLEAPDVVVTTDYGTAKKLFVDNNQQAAMQAFMQGKIKAQGDLAKLMVPPPPKNDAQKEFELKVQEITE